MAPTITNVCLSPQTPAHPHYRQQQDSLRSAELPWDLLAYASPRGLMIGQMEHEDDP